VHIELLLNSSPAILLHVVCALAALAIGAIQLFSQKGTSQHKVLGYIWVGLMFIISISAFWIKELMPRSPVFGFSPIHLLSIWVIYQLFRGIYFARKSDIIRHARCMKYTYLGGLIVAGLLTLLPGRVLFKVLF
jgi:uncharacterized membrane protein